jgi:ABC transporter with metal-binding/Fe-S-binding domain ATP-binding protein
LKFAGLFSGGKDSVFSILKSVRAGHELSCIIIMHPKNDESLLYHYPNHHILPKVAGALEVPIIEIKCGGTDKKTEINRLYDGIHQAITQFEIRGLCHGCIHSDFQMNIFQQAADKFNIELLSPLWKIDTETYYNTLFRDNFEIILTRVAANGLDDSWLGKAITPITLKNLKFLSKKFGFNLDFEGGEAETLVLNCPLYKKRIITRSSGCQWDGIRGIFEISDVELIEIKRSNA